MKEINQYKEEEIQMETYSLSNKAHRGAKAGSISREYFLKDLHSRGKISDQGSDRSRNPGRTGGEETFAMLLLKLPADYRTGYQWAMYAIQKTIERHHHMRRFPKKVSGGYALPIPSAAAAENLLSLARRELRRIFSKSRAKASCI